MGQGIWLLGRLRGDQVVKEGPLSHFLSLRFVHSETRLEYEVLPREEDSGFCTFNEPFWSNDLHMSKLPRLRWGKRACDNMGYQALLVKIGMKCAPVLHDELTEVLNRGLCPPIDVDL